uniref:Uncharacterized protein n=1 Tax=Moniliophthora roreri TaxID=221103 RepID=A0A0W0FJI3_MONRR
MGLDIGFNNSVPWLPTQVSPV